jgi:uncharacterized protein (DUF58 family)
MRPVESRGQILVWPEVVPLAGRANDAGHPGNGPASRARRSGSQGEFFGARPYRGGESLRQIHWKQSARHDELIVWESQAPATGVVTLLVETDPEVHAGGSLEKVLSVAASFAAALVGSGVRVGLAFSHGGAFLLHNRQQLESALDALARFEEGQGAGLASLFEPLAHHRRSGRPWVVTTLAGWKRAARLSLPRRSRMVLVDERDPPRGEAPAALPGRPDKVPLVPIHDPGHRRLFEAWKEVAVASEPLV